MTDLARGVVAGFVATVFISMLMILRLAMGIMPWFDPIEILNLSAQSYLGTPDSAAIGWFIHFVVGSLIWGLLYVALEPFLPGGTDARRGLVFGLLAWLLVKLTVFPMAGSGLFGLGFGLFVPVMTLIAHAIFGAVLGACYGWLRRVRPRLIHRTV